MPATYVTGDLFAWPNLTAFGHGCNCAGAMGKGIAVEFRRRWPRMYEEYKRRCLDGRFRVGDVFVWKEGAHTIFNLGTQRTWRTKAELPDVERAVDRMLYVAAEENLPRVGIPRIGAGLGGLDWATVKRALSRIAASSPVELLVFEEFSKAQP